MSVTWGRSLLLSASAVPAPHVPSLSGRVAQPPRVDLWEPFLRRAAAAVCEAAYGLVHAAWPRFPPESGRPGPLPGGCPSCAFVLPF